MSSSPSPARAAADLAAWRDIDALRRRLREGLAIPAHPLALDAGRASTRAASAR